VLRTFSLVLAKGEEESKGMEGAMVSSWGCCSVVFGLPFAYFHMGCGSRGETLQLKLHLLEFYNKLTTRHARHVSRQRRSVEDEHEHEDEEDKDEDGSEAQRTTRGM